MVKILVLQQLYNLADDALEYQLLDRRSLLQFLDLTESSSIPGAKTIWLFRDSLAQARSCSSKSSSSCSNTAIWHAATKSSMPHWCRRRSNATSVRKLTLSTKARCRLAESRTSAQKDVNARWTKKHGKIYFGYKLHASVDKRYKLLRKTAQPSHCHTARTCRSRV
jgi:IS5 family transposase